jgi:hypothetical protein
MFSRRLDADLFFFYYKNNFNFFLDIITYHFFKNPLILLNCFITFYFLRDFCFKLIERFVLFQYIIFSDFYFLFCNYIRQVYFNMFKFMFLEITYFLFYAKNDPLDY